MNVLGIGESTIDITRFDRQTPTGIVSTIDATKHVGGVVLAALVVLARLGTRCTYITSVGRDAEGTLVRKALADENIKTTFHLQKQTKVNTMIVDADSRQRIGKLRSATRHTPITHLEPALVRSADVIILDRHERAAFYEIMRLKRQTTSVLIDPSTEVSDFTLDMIRLAEHPVVPIETLAQLPGEDLLSALDALHGISNKAVTVTAGAMGCILYDGTAIEVVRPLELQPVDTSGAGDVYRGAYAYGILQGWSQRRTASFANTIAGLQCTNHGNMSAIPHRFTMLQAAKVRPAKLKQIYLRDIAQHYRELCTTFQQTTVETQA